MAVEEKKKRAGDGEGTDDNEPHSLVFWKGCFIGNFLPVLR